MRLPDELGPFDPGGSACRAAEFCVPAAVTTGADFEKFGNYSLLKIEDVL